MDQRMNGNSCSCCAIIYSLHLAIEVRVHCNIAVGSCQIPVKYPVCTLAAKVAKDFGQHRFDFFYTIICKHHIFLSLSSLVTFRKASKLADEAK